MSAIIEKARDLDQLLAVAVQDDAEAGLRADLAEVIARLTAEPAEAERTLAAVRRLLG